MSRPPWLFYKGGTGEYKLPVHLEGGASSMVSVAELIMRGAADADGSVIPPDVESGSATVADRIDHTAEIHVQVGTGVFNARTATCTPNCIDCAGFVSVAVNPSPFAVPVNMTTQLTEMATYSDGTTSSGTGGTWSSSNTSLASVNTGMVSGLAGGSVTVSDTLLLRPKGRVCPQPHQPNRCPASRPFNGGSPGPVQVPTRTRVVSDLIQQDSAAFCATNGLSGDGWYRETHNIVLDQFNGDIKRDGISLTEVLTLGGRDDLRLGSKVITSGATTSGGGFFDDNLAACSLLCPANAGETDATQVVQYNGIPMAPNAFQYKCRQVLVNGSASAP